MGTAPLQIDYTNKDYESFRAMMLTNIPILTPEWTDTSESDLGIVLVELLSHGLDIISYYQDKMANEAYLPTAQLRSSVINLCKPVGYTLANATPAKVYVVFTLNQPAPSTGYVIPKGTQVSTQPTSTEDAIIFETDSTLTIPSGAYGNEQSSGAYTYQVSATQGQTVTNEVLGSSNHQPDQYYYPQYAPVIVDSSFVINVINSAGATQQWTSVSDFLDSQPNDQVYTLEVDENSEATVTFGSGSSGAIPDVGTNNILCTYRVGGGSYGNTGANTITNIISDLSGISSVTNPSAPYQLGTDMEDISHAKQNAPIAYRTNQRAVTLPDFADLVVSNFSSSLTTPIIKAVAVNAAVSDWNADVYVYCTRTDLQPLSTNDITAITNYLNTCKIINCAFSVLTGTLVQPTLSMTVTLQQSFVQSYVQNLVQQAVLNYVQTANFDYGVSLLMANLSTLIMGIQGVQNVVINSSDIVVPEASIIKTMQLANLTVNVTGGIAG